MKKHLLKTMLTALILLMGGVNGAWADDVYTILYGTPIYEGTAITGVNPQTDFTADDGNVKTLETASSDGNGLTGLTIEGSVLYSETSFTHSFSTPATKGLVHFEANYTATTSTRETWKIIDSNGIEIFGTTSAGESGGNATKDWGFSNGESLGTTWYRIPRSGHNRVELDINLTSKKVAYKVWASGGTSAYTILQGEYALPASVVDVAGLSATRTKNYYSSMDAVSFYNVYDDAVSEQSYSINYQLGGTTVATETGAGAVGGTVNAQSSIWDKDNTQKYFVTSDATTSFTIGEGSNEFNVAVRKAENWTLTINAALDDETNLLGLSTIPVVEGETVDYGYSQYIAVNESLYKSVQQTSNPWWGGSFTPTADGQAVNILYTDQNEKAYLCKEAEDIEGMTIVEGGNTDIRASNRKGGYGVDGADVLIQKVDPGVYKIKSAAYGNPGTTFIFKAGDVTVFELATSGNPELKESEEFTLYEETEITVSGGNGGNSPKVVDYVIFQRLRDATVAAPTFTPAATTDELEEAFDLTLNCETEGADIYYTIDGTEPTAESLKYEEGTSIIHIDATTTIKAIAILGTVSSEVATSTYTFKAAAEVLPTDVTNQYLTNADFSGDYSAVTATPTATDNDRDIFQPTGWNISMNSKSQYNMSVVKPGDLQQTNYFKDTYEPTDGKYMVRFRQDTTDEYIDLSQTITITEAGLYLLSADLISEDRSKLKVELYAGTQTVANYKNGTWQNRCLLLNVTANQEITIGVKFSNNNGNQKRGGADNIKLMKLGAAPVDVTSLIVNPDFDSNIDGWTAPSGGANLANNRTEFTTNFYETWNGDPKTGRMYQQLSNLPSGTYKLKVYAFAKDKGDMTPFSTDVAVYAQGQEVGTNTSSYIHRNYVNSTDFAYYETWAYVDSNGKLEIGMRQDAATFQWLGMDNVTLQYVSSENQEDELLLAELQNKWSGIVTDLNTNILNGDTYANVKGVERANFANEMATATAAPITAIGDYAAKATTALRDAYLAFVNPDVKAKYDNLATAIANAETAGVDATDAKAVRDNPATTADDAQDAAILLNNTVAVKDATTLAPVLTNFVTNGTFDENVDGWTSTGGFQNKGLKEAVSGTLNKFWENWNGEAKVNKMFQTIKNIPNGTYRLDISAFANAIDGENSYVFANSDKTTLTAASNPGADYQVYTYVENNTIEIGLEQTTATANWMGIDNVSLRYYGPTNVITEAQFGSHKLDYDEALEAANTALSADDYKNVTGSERVSLQAKVDEAEPTTIEGYDDAADALKTLKNAFVNAKPNYDALVAEIAIAKSIGIADATANDYAATSTTTAETALSNTQELKVLEYTHVTTNYTKEIAFGTWTEDFAEDLNGEGYKANGPTYWNEWGSATRTAKQTMTLPAGDYAISSIGRGQPGTSGYLYYKIGGADAVTRAFLMKDNRGLGVDTEGRANFTPHTDDNGINYNCNNEGYGWEYRFLTFHLDAAADVEIGVSAAFAYAWVSIYAPQLFMTESSFIALENQKVNDYLVITKAKYEGDYSTIESAIAENAYTTEAAGIAAIKALRNPIATASLSEGDDLTGLIDNNSFETGNTKYWTTTASYDTGARSNSGDYAMSNADGSYLFNTWWTGTPLTQNIGTLPAGAYELKGVVASDGGTIYITMNDLHEAFVETADNKNNSPTVCKNVGIEFAYTFTLDEAQEVTIGVVGGAEGAKGKHKEYQEDGYWFYKADNFRLTYLGTTAPENTIDGTCVLSTDGYKINRGGDSGTEAEMNSAVGIPVVISTDKAGISTIKLTDTEKYLMYNDEMVYTDGTVDPQKEYHKPYWKIIPVTGGYNILNTQSGLYLTTANVTRNAKEITVATLSATPAVWTFGNPTIDAKKVELAAAIAAAPATPTENVGTAAFQIPQAEVTKLTNAKSNGQTVYENPTATLEDVNNAIAAFSSYDIETLNAPAADKLYNVVNITNGFTHAGKALTFMSASNADLTGNTTTMGWLYEPGSIYPQGVKFTPVDGVKNGYTMSYTRADGNTIYVSTGKTSELGNNTAQIRPTTDATKALTVVVNSVGDNKWTLFNTEDQHSIGSSGDTGFYTAGGSNKDMKIQEAIVNEVSLDIKLENQYGTLILPFKADIPSGVVIYSVDKVNGNEIDLKAVNGTQFEANTPYVVFAENGVEATLSGLGAAYTDASYTTGLLTGTYEQINAPIGSYVLQNHDGNVAFYRVQETIPPVNANRAYLSVPSSEARVFYLNGEATAIKAIEALTVGDAEIYDVNGRRQVKLQKGVNIIRTKDGRTNKVMVK